MAKVVQEIFLIYFFITIDGDGLMNVLAEKVHEGQIKSEFTGRINGFV
jgi:hypothetical protein